MLHGNREVHSLNYGSAKSIFGLWNQIQEFESVFPSLMDLVSLCTRMIQTLKSTRVTLVEEGGSLEAILGNYRSLKKHKEYTTLVTQERKNVKTNVTTSLPIKYDTIR